MDTNEAKVLVAVSSWFFMFIRSTDQRSMLVAGGAWYEVGFTTVAGATPASRQQHGEIAPGDLCASYSCHFNISEHKNESFVMLAIKTMSAR